MAKKYDVIIVGGGPAGIFTALELSRVAGIKVLLVEKGRDIDERDCPSRDSGSSCLSCSPCNLVCGLGGAGAFSDGKLTLTWEVGGRLKECLSDYDTRTLINYVDDIYLKFGAPTTLYGRGDRIEEWLNRARQWLWSGSLGRARPRSSTS